MHRALSARWLSRSLISADAASFSRSVPLFLCPALASYSTTAQATPPSAPAAARAVPPSQPNNISLEPEEVDLPEVSFPKEIDHAKLLTERLPVSCTGCGAFAQTKDPKQLGYYNPKSRRLHRWVEGRDTRKRFNKKQTKTREVAAAEAENAIVEAAFSRMGEAELKRLGLDLEHFKTTSDIPPEEEIEGTPAVPDPLCERCHLLVHESGSAAINDVQIFHPTVDSLRETIEESPHKHNHIYHVIDAADFPMSLVPRLNVLLGDIPMRGRNRRSRSAKYMHDRKTELSFIITRGDLLAPTKEQVDKLMPYLREVLRDALGRLGDRVRLGNVRCVSAKRNWWTRELKEEIWKRGGAGWMVGKVNVGKSRLLEAVYPKGKLTAEPKADETYETRLEARRSGLGEEAEDDVDYGDLLPPPRPLEMYPDMPVVSSLPGTTASPIRLPFGDNKGELIDLPGLARGDLELFVSPKYRQSIVLETRIKPEQHGLRHGSSLILGGGLIRITPTTPGLQYLMYNFTPLKEHITATEKAIEFQAQLRHAPAVVEKIASFAAADKTKLAGTFKLSWDVTKKRAGPVTMKHRGGVPVEKLPFRVLSTDILIEGVGYIEIVAQIRTKDFEEMVRSETAREFGHAQGEEPTAPEPTTKRTKRTKTINTSADPWDQMKAGRIDDSPEARARAREREEQAARKRALAVAKREWPAVEVYTPEGRFVGSRQPIGGYLLNKPLVKAEHKRSRPRKSMKGYKKHVKEVMRTVSQSAE